MIRRALGIARQMVPPADMALRCGIRVALAGGVLGVASILPVPLLAKIVHYAGITLVMFSLFAVIGHAEGVFMNHIVSWIKARWTWN